MRKTLAILSLLLLFSALSACTSIPDGVEPITGFDANRYLGTWYEIARLDHPFERGLSKVSATYSERDDGGIKVVNKGYSEQDGKWSQAEGRAYFMDGADIGFLKVSFFGPFYGSYIIFDLAPDYSVSMVAGPDRSYLWLLARTPTVDASVIDRFIERATALGFDTDTLIRVQQ
jgi:apolipoprotein D and lipocalin family protein